MCGDAERGSTRAGRGNSVCGMWGKAAVSVSSLVWFSFMRHRPIAIIVHLSAAKVLHPLVARRSSSSLSSLNIEYRTSNALVIDSSSGIHANTNGHDPNGLLCITQIPLLPRPSSFASSLRLLVSIWSRSARLSPMFSVVHIWDHGAFGKTKKWHIRLQ